MQALRQAFFDAYIERHPEEATTLGIDAGADRLRDHAPAALADEERWYRSIKDQLDAIDPAALSIDDRLDYLCMSRLVGFHLYAHGWLYSTIDWALYPYNMMEVQRIHAHDEVEKRALASRLKDLPRFLEQQEKNVDRAIADGVRIPDGTLREFFVSTQLPAAIDSLRDLGHERAAAAYETHRAWMAGIQTTDARSIGEDDLRFRLQKMLGVDDEPTALVAGAREDLHEIQDALVRIAAEVAPSRNIKTLADARALAHEMQEKKLRPGDDVVGFYRDYVERATQLVREQELFDIPIT